MATIGLAFLIFSYFWNEIRGEITSDGLIRLLSDWVCKEGVMKEPNGWEKRI